MPLSEAFNTASQDTPSSKCKTCSWYAQLSEDDKVFFDSKVEDPDTNYNLLLRACKMDSGLDCVNTSFRNHIYHHHHSVKVTK